MQYVCWGKSGETCPLLDDRMSEGVAHSLSLFVLCSRMSSLERLHQNSHSTEVLLQLVKLASKECVFAERGEEASNTFCYAVSHRVLISLQTSVCRSSVL